MGRGIVINDVDDKGFVEVRMSNGHIEKYFPEELETNEEVNARRQNQMTRASDKWKDMW